VFDVLWTYAKDVASPATVFFIAGVYFQNKLLIKGQKAFADQLGKFSEKVQNQHDHCTKVHAHVDSHMENLYQRIDKLEQITHSNNGSAHVDK
jgi:hypothetical protein